MERNRKMLKVAKILCAIVFIGMTLFIVSGLFSEFKRIQNAKEQRIENVIELVYDYSNRDDEKSLFQTKEIDEDEYLRLFTKVSDKAGISEKEWNDFEKDMDNYFKTIQPFKETYEAARSQAFIDMMARDASKWFSETEVPEYDDYDVTWDQYMADLDNAEKTYDKAIEPFKRALKKTQVYKALWKIRDSEELRELNSLRFK